MTASAVCSLSLDPVLLVVCIDNRLATHRAVEASKRFAVNVLGERDEELARRFARRAEDKFAGVALATAPTRRCSPRRSRTSSATVQERVPGGDHSIFIGKVLHCEATPGCRPLLYYRSAFAAMHDPHAELLAEAGGWDAGSVGGLGSPTLFVERRVMLAIARRRAEEAAWQSAYFVIRLMSSGLIRSSTVQPSRSYSAMHCSAKPFILSTVPSPLAIHQHSRRVSSWLPE